MKRNFLIMLLFFLTAFAMFSACRPAAVPTLLASTANIPAPSDAELEAQVLVTRDADTLPADCSVHKVAATLLRFVDAFNRDDQRQLADVFVMHPRYAVAEGGGMESTHRFFETTDQSELLKYFAERHQNGERMRLLAVDTSNTLGWHGGVDFAYGLTRQADDLLGSPNHIATGKGAMTCPELKIYLLTISSGAIVATPSGTFGSCPKPPSDSPPNAVIACTREQP